MTPLSAEERALSAWLLASLGAALAMAGVNAVFFHYTGACYFPRLLTPGLFAALQCAYYGVRRDLALYALAMIVLAALVTGAQFTPFPPIDPLLVRADRALGFDTVAVLSWTCARPALRRLLAACYASTDLQLALVPLAAFLSPDRRRARVFLRAIVYTSLAGTLFYYAWPSSGPAGAFPSPLFAGEQRLTAMKFFAVHHFRPVDTLAGGMVAFPSFHVAWSILLPYAAGGRRRLFWPVTALNALVILSTVLLGWHYLVDVPAGILLAALGLLAAGRGAPVTRPTRAAQIRTR